MSFLTEYFDEFRQHPIRKTKTCYPENRWPNLRGNWLDPKVGSTSKAMTDEDIKKFIKDIMMSIRGRSVYFNDYCAHLDQSFKTRPFIPRVKKLVPCAELFEKKVVEETLPTVAEAPKLAMKDTVLMKMAEELYTLDVNSVCLRPLPTHFRVLGYVRPEYWHTGITDYQHGIARLAYEMVKADAWPRFHKHNGCKPHYGIPPEAERQPELDGIPFESERMY